VKDAEAESSRAQAFEISATGPMFGCTMMEPEGAQYELEREVLAAETLTPASFNLAGALRMDGERRPLRVQLTGAAVEEDAGDIIVSFALPRGSYATCVMSEIMKAG